MEDKKWWIPYLIAGIMLVIGTLYDYQIDVSLYHPNNIFGLFMQRYVLCFFIAGLTFVFALLQRVYHQWLFLVPELITAVYAVIEVGKYICNVNDHLLLMGLSGIGVAAFCHLIIYRMPIHTLQRIEKKAVFYACVFISSVVLAGIIKLFWGRVRFRELSDISQFTVWFIPQGINGHHSFPSGHTIAFSSLLCVLVMLKQCEKHKVPWYIVGFVYGAILAMAVSRMIMGAHYLSDVTVGFLITYTIFLGYQHYFYRKGYL